MLGLLSRLLPEDEPHPDLYRKLEELISTETKDLERKEAEMAFEVLVALGYADSSADVNELEKLILEVNKGILAAGL